MSRLPSLGPSQTGTPAYLCGEAVCAAALSGGLSREARHKWWPA